MAGLEKRSMSGNGLFSGAGTSASGGLFGTKPAGTGTAAGGLFGGSTSTQGSTGGQFGGNSSSSAITFGGQPGQTTTPASGGAGLFGGAGTASAGGATGGGGLFGGGGQSASATGTTGGGLFGGGGGATTTGGGLFGGTTATGGGGLMGTSTTTGGLFGNPGTTSAGGLFGATAGRPAAGGLFGGTTTTGAGGLFNPAGGVAGVSGAKVDPNQVWRTDLYTGPELRPQTQSTALAGLIGSMGNSNTLYRAETTSGVHSIKALGVTPSKVLAKASQANKAIANAGRASVRDSDGSSGSANPEVARFKPMYEQTFKGVEAEFDVLKNTENPYCSKTVGTLPPETLKLLVEINTLIKNSGERVKKLHNGAKDIANIDLAKVKSNIDDGFIKEQAVNIKLKAATQKMQDIAEHLVYFKQKIMEFQVNAESLRTKKTLRPNTEGALREIGRYLNEKLHSVIQNLCEIMDSKAKALNSNCTDTLNPEENLEDSQSFALIMNGLFDLLLLVVKKVSEVRHQTHLLKQRLGISGHHLPTMRLGDLRETSGMMEEQINPANHAVQELATLLYR